MVYENISEWLQPSGLLIHAIVHRRNDVVLPKMKNGMHTGTLLLIGNAGSSNWPAFSHSKEYKDGLADPLDRWSMRLGNDLAAIFAGEALFPFSGPPFLPFLNWDRHANATITSPLGLSLHPKYGLWYGYRFALALPHEHTLQPTKLTSSDSCKSCHHQACLSACPVDAFAEGNYHYQDCVDYLGQNCDCDCNRSGCLARHKCPIGQNYRYEAEHAQFHMQAFIASCS